MKKNPATDPEFARILAGYGLTTAEIVYRLPDYRDILQTYIWQEYDFAPEFPELRKFLGFWYRTLDGPLYQVRVAHTHLIQPREFEVIGHMLVLH
ncbi:aspartate-semialdehyde dehydrogenase [Candidatus Kaiserbacteria bacterium]|nr:aspartate-semialdehyde dehydrogenase [Candidatus Kaiserbacteria bacterium]